MEERVTAKGHIEVRPEYGCHPLWTDTGCGWRENTDPDTLPVEAMLARDLTAWAADFDATPNHGIPRTRGSLIRLRRMRSGRGECFWLGVVSILRGFGRWLSGPIDGRVPHISPVAQA
jgi:hypothetical protein